MREPIDLNTASKEDLMRLQHVSARAAERVVEYRARRGRFESLDDLAGVNGLGNGTIDRIRDQVVVAPGSMAECHRRWLDRGRS